MTSTVEVVLSPSLQTFLVIRCICEEKPPKMTGKANEKSIREKIDEFLHEKNYFTDGLELIEKNTGVNRLYICLGKLSFWPKLPALLHTGKYESAKLHMSGLYVFLEILRQLHISFDFHSRFKGVARRNNRLILCFASLPAINMAPNCFLFCHFLIINCSFLASYGPWLYSS